MSKLRLFREAEATVPNGPALAGNIYFTEEQNLYVINNAGEKVKFTDVVFVPDEASLAALPQQFRNKIYVAMAEGTLWRTDGSTWYPVGKDSFNRAAEIIDVPGTSITLTNDIHLGKWLRFTNAAGCTVEMDATLPNGFQCMFYKDVAGGSIHFSGNANFISPSASIDDEYATVHALVIGGKVKFKGDFV